MPRRFLLLCLLAVPALALPDANDGRFMGYQLGETYPAVPKTSEITTSGNLLIVAEDPVKPDGIDEVSLIATPETRTIGYIAATSWHDTEEAARANGRRYAEALRKIYPDWDFGRELMDARLRIVEVNFDKAPHNLQLRLVRDQHQGRDMWRFSMGLGWQTDSPNLREWQTQAASERNGCRNRRCRATCRRPGISGFVTYLFHAAGTGTGSTNNETTPQGSLRTGRVAIEVRNPCRPLRDAARYRRDVMDVSIYTASPGDAAELATFAARLFEQTYSAELSGDDIEAHVNDSFGIDQQHSELSDPSVVTILARSGDDLIAYAQVRRRAPPPCVEHAEPVELQRFYVDRVAHGTGLATMLMNKVRKAAGRLGGHNLWLGVWERNARAIAFYRKAGFIDVGSTFYMVGPDKQVDRVLVAPVRMR